MIGDSEPCESDGNSGQVQVGPGGHMVVVESWAPEHAACEGDRVLEPEVRVVIERAACEGDWVLEPEVRVVAEAWAFGVVFIWKRSRKMLSRSSIMVSKRMNVRVKASRRPSYLTR